MDLETVLLKDLFGSSVYHTMHHRACGRTISWLLRNLADRECDRL